MRGSDGEIVTRYRYGPFGEQVEEQSENVVCPFRFSTKYYDEEAAIYYYGYRYYSLSTGRWLSRDPVEEEGGVNLYRFVVNQPVNLIDVLGMEPFQFTDPIFPEQQTEADVDVTAENLCSCNKAGTVTVTISVPYPIADTDLDGVNVRIDGRKAPVNIDPVTDATKSVKGKTLDICPMGSQSGTIEVELDRGGHPIKIGDDPGNNNPGTKLTISYKYECEIKNGQCSIKSDFEYEHKIE